MSEASSESAAKTAEKTRDAQRSAGGAATSAVETERRTFEEGVRTASETAQGGVDAARDMARRGMEATRRFTEDGRRTTLEFADMWREAFDPLLTAQMEMNRWMDQLWRQAAGFGVMPSLRTARPFAAFSPAPMFGLPATDVKETERAYELSVELPGMNRDDIELKIQGGALTLCGRKAEQKEDLSAAYRVSERRYGWFERSFPVPPDAQPEQIEAAYNDGVLKITLPKAEQAGAAPGRRIDVR